MIILQAISKTLKSERLSLKQDTTISNTLKITASITSGVFKHYSRSCMRLHFFNSIFNKNEFEDFIIKYNPEDTEAEEQTLYKNIYDSYCGFLVIKPIPFTIFGRTCLKTYNKNKTTRKNNKEIKQFRFYPTNREYKASVFGIEFKVNTVAYQEQDNQVFVCATTSIWVAFQCTSKSFDHIIPTPYDITLIAKGGKTPNKEGLTNNEIMKAISEQGLHPIILKFKTVSEAKAVLYAYLKCGIPVILGGPILKQKDSYTEDKEHQHAITALGYDMVDREIPPYSYKSNSENKKKTQEKTQLFLVSSFIEQVYVHDDQIGTFVRMKFDKEISKNEQVEFVDIPWGKFDKNFKNQKSRFIITLALIPLYHKIRIPFNKILKIINEFNSIAFAEKEKKLVWDIYLTTICEFKNKLRLDNSFEEKELKIKLITSNLPRFIWVADAYEKYDIEGNTNPNFSFYFDATDMENSDVFLFAIHNNIDDYINRQYYIYSMRSEDREKSSFQTRQIFAYYLGDISDNPLNIREEIQSYYRKKAIEKLPPG
ncbi:MAG: hypothetical protein LBG28_15625 [Tannerella sp.]|nr:hypothetical protein [Tannerella sp.]